MFICPTHVVSSYFNPRTREGCDCAALQTVSENLISIHAPARGATGPIWLGSRWVGMNFNPRTREGCDKLCKCELDCDCADFNPRTREGCDMVVCVPPQLDELISIHAPARGATQPAFALTEKVNISIHAPARGATIHNKAYSAQITFQSTHPRGVRLPTFKLTEFCRYFNPRTREGCDTTISHYGQFRKNFNPRTREGCDAQRVLYIRSLIQFQSTHPRGVRQVVVRQSHIHLHFNPRTREGCDTGFHEHLGAFPAISIHAPARGATDTTCKPAVSRWKFQSTHPRGVRHCQWDDMI